MDKNNNKSTFRDPVYNADMLMSDIDDSASASRTLLS